MQAQLILYSPREVWTNLDIVAGEVSLTLPTATDIAFITVKLEGDMRTVLAAAARPELGERSPRTMEESHKVCACAAFALLRTFEDLPPWKHIRKKYCHLINRCAKLLHSVTMERTKDRVLEVLDSNTLDLDYLLTLSQLLYNVVTVFPPNASSSSIISSRHYKLNAGHYQYPFSFKVILHTP